MRHTAGTPILDLYASTDALDTDWIAHLLEEHPDGSAQVVASGFLRGRYRSGYEAPDLIKPGAVANYRIELSDCFVTLPPGTALRLLVTSSNFSGLRPQSQHRWIGPGPDGPSPSAPDPPRRRTVRERLDVTRAGADREPGAKVPAI